MRTTRAARFATDLDPFSHLPPPVELAEPAEAADEAPVADPAPLPDKASVAPLDPDRRRPIARHRRARGSIQMPLPPPPNRSRPRPSHAAPPPPTATTKRVGPSPSAHESPSPIEAVLPPPRPHVAVEPRPVPAPADRHRAPSRRAPNHPAPTRRPRRRRRVGGRVLFAIVFAAIWATRAFAGLFDGDDQTDRTTVTAATIAADERIFGDLETSCAVVGSDPVRGLVVQLAVTNRGPTDLTANVQMRVERGDGALAALPAAEVGPLAPGAGAQPVVESQALFLDDVASLQCEVDSVQFG